MNLSRLIGAGVALALALVIAGPAGSQAGAVATAVIRVFQFEPGALEVPAGTRVTWSNEDDITHTVTSGVAGRPDGRFDVQLAGKGARGSTTFTTRGVYPYFCARHESMKGEVVVR